MESWVQSWRPRTNAFAIFPFTCLKYCVCPKKWCQVIWSAAPVTQNHLPKTEDLMLQNANHFRKSAPWPKREGFVAFPKTMAGVGHMQTIWQDAFRVAGAVQETCSSEMLRGQGVDFLKWVAFWGIRSSVLTRWFCATGAALRMTRGRRSTLDRWMEKSQTHWYEAVSSALNFPFLKGVSQNCFVFDVVHFLKIEEVSQDCVSFLMLSSSKIEEVSQNSFVFKLAHR